MAKKRSAEAYKKEQQTRSHLLYKKKKIKQGEKIEKIGTVCAVNKRVKLTTED